jgi:hypothetical protein
VSPGPYWDTEAQGQGSFLDGRPRDPARIPRLLDALAHAWIAHPTMSLGRLLDLELDRGGIPENEFVSRWLRVEDRPLQRMLNALAVDSSRRAGSAGRRTRAPQPQRPTPTSKPPLTEPACSTGMARDR